MAPISVTLTMLRRMAQVQRFRAPSAPGGGAPEHHVGGAGEQVVRQTVRHEASVRMEHGATTMPAHWNEPLAMLAPRCGRRRLVRQRPRRRGAPGPAHGAGRASRRRTPPGGIGAGAFAQHLQQAHP